jgi:hypothetical protein
MSSSQFREPIYFGCRRAGECGHYAFTQTGRQYGHNEHWIDLLDGMFQPEGPEIEGVARLHHLNGMTILAFWDRSGDSRPASNSAFVLKGKLTFAEALAEAKQRFPWVFERFTFEVVPEQQEAFA